jgi:glycosyltransferase involved in cell wall biosynthesis
MGEPNFTGVGVIIDNLVRNLAKIDKENEYFLCYRLSRVKKKWLKNPVNQENFHFKIIQEPLNFLFERKIDLFHGAERLPGYSRPKKVVTIHDLAAVLGGDFMTGEFREMIKKRYSELVRGKADHIITLSEAAKSDICGYYNLDESMVSVVYPGVYEGFKPLSKEETGPVLDKFGLSGRYILHVGALQERKNIVRILEAFRGYADSGHEDVRLVFCGKPTYGYERIEETIKRLKLEEKVSIFGHVGQEELVALYNGAMMLCFPSLFEGFGIPIAEAFACGCPVITSNVTSMPEVAGDAGIIVDPERVEEIEAAMQRLTDEEERARMGRLAMERSSLFTYREAAEKVLGIYKRVAG